jgi:hypothetical protein
LVSGFKPFFSHRLCSSAFLAAIFFFLLLVFFFFFKNELILTEEEDFSLDFSLLRHCCEIGW